MEKRINLNLVILLAANLAYVVLVAAIAWSVRQPAITAAWAALASNAYWLPRALGRRAR